ncbi:Plant invertase/pectin methylesterase inhibitor superfamily protein [Striga hermonthica]|uniref:Plant invertase/pectin methylesterase inhibitor superfamily protein n=1 Tax=Striga hermonthica TaxID=68872 RepID=A0A9N7NK57_STRHE|nr:Plant invertase/pectin methylesterase inhibitor superfamily protein [Striga hermonthica]
MVRFIVLMLLLAIYSCSSASGSDDTNNGYVRDVCSVTRYPDLCVHSLSSFSKTAGQSPSRWARASVSVTIGEAKKVALYLSTLSRSNRAMRGRNRVALSDCIECFGDALDNLHKSLYVLRKLSVREFGSQVDDVATWVSSALTDEDTCVDGFIEGGKGKRVRSIVNRVSNVTYMTSNALALIDKLATAGPRCLVDD